MGSAEAPRDVAPGEVVGGKWRIVRLIGRGGMGAVYEAQNTGIGKRVALKFIDAEYAGNADIVRRFQREAEAASVVESAHIVHVFDSGTTDQGIPYIVMELLQGEDLRSRIRRMGTLPPGEAVHIAVQMLRGLHRAHAAGIVHRDLKPDNVFLVDRDDDPLFAKIVDFGISKMTTRAGDAVGTLTRQGMVLGTPYYMSPEQAQAVSDLDGRTDLWSVGAILFECLAGHPPFQGDAYEPIIVAICTGAAPDVRTVNPAVPPALASVVRRALARERQQRFASAREMLEALEATGLGAAATEPSARTRVSWTQAGGHGGTSAGGERGLFGRHRTLAALGLGLMAATFAATFAWLRLARSSRTTAVAEGTTLVAAAASAPVVSAEPSAAPAAAVAPAPSVEPRAAAEPSSGARRPPAPSKKRSPTAASAGALPALPPAFSGSTTSPKPGVAGGLQIKTTYP